MQRPPRPPDAIFVGTRRGSVVDREVARMALALAIARILVGIVWLANLTWKLPPGFGRDDPRGLLYSFQRGEQYAVIGPLRDLVGSVVIPHFTIFGWLVFTVELVAGLLLTFGFRAEVGAALGTAQSLAIMALIIRAPDEWFWGYVMFVVLNVLPLIGPASSRLSIDHLRGEQ